jgi:GT2 family glycosyltransferase
VPDATIVITTRDRCDELAPAVETALAQRGVDIEVLVIDDGSRDGTSAMLADRYPTVRVDRTEHSLGLIKQRTRAARLARSPIIVSIDDDARLVSEHTVAQTLEDFDHERVGAVAIPFLDVRQQGTVARQVAPDRDGRWVTHAYIGTAHALRRDLFLALGGYRGSLVRQGEEFDYCLRMLAAGRVVRLGRADRLEHHESPRRPLADMFRLSTRNELLRTFYLVPLPQAVLVAVKQVLGNVDAARRHGLGRAGLRGVWNAAVMAAHTRGERRPVSATVFRADRELRRRGPLRLTDLEPLLPVLDSSAEAARLVGGDIVTA